MKNRVNTDVDPRVVTLTRRDTGEKKEFILRLFREGDEDGIVACIRAEYGDSYFKTHFYDPVWIRENAISEKYCFFVAETEGRIAGIEVLTFFPGVDDCVEPASQILEKESRGYGLSWDLAVYTFDVMEVMDVSSIFVHAVMFHKITQRTCEKLNMVPVGFRLGRFLSEKMKNSYPIRRCDKHSEGVLIKPVKKRDAGVIYLPEELKAFGEKTYQRLAVACQICTDAPAYTDDRPEKGEYRIDVDEEQEFVAVQVVTDGKDLVDRMKSLVESYRGKGKYSIQVTLFDDSPVILDTYDKLKETGFFFTGLKPVCGEREQFYMQWVDDWNLFMEDYVLTDAFEEIRRDIECFYDRRRGL